MLNTTYTREVHSLKAINRGLMIAIMMMALAITGLVGLVFYTSKTQVAWVPPDTSQGALVELDKPDKPNVYGFTNYILQYLNHWPNDGAVDYKDHIFELSYYITPAYKDYLETDYRTLSNRHGINELDGRQRMLQPISGKRFTARSVQEVADGVWNVTLYYRLSENYKRENIKDVEMKYVMRVVQAEVDTETNQWGLKLDVPVEEPSRLVAGE